MMNTVFKFMNTLFNDDTVFKFMNTLFNDEYSIQIYEYTIQ